MILFRDNASHPTQNAWEHVFYHAVLANTDMLAYLTGENLPAYR